MKIYNTTHRSRLLSLLMIAILLAQAALPVTALAAAQTAPVEGSLPVPPAAPFVNCASVSGIQSYECEALLELYYSTQGINWTMNTDWIQTDTPCAWYGITCEGGYVTKIILYYNNLNGSLPSTLGNLSHLAELDLSDNYLSGQIPASFGNLISLNTLYLNWNELEGSLPIELGNLGNLVHLNVNGNLLDGPIPVDLGQLTTLQELDLGQNGFSGGIPIELGNLTALEYLYLYDNQVTGNIPSEIGNLVNLIELDLASNQLEGEFPQSIINLVNLTLFHFDCQLTSSDPEVIAFIDSIVPDWENSICLPEGSIVSISGNAGAPNVVLNYFDGVQQSFVSDNSGAYSFEVTYGWTGQVIPSLEGHVFTPGCRDYEFAEVNGNRVRQDYTASGQPPLPDSPGDTSRASLDSSGVQGNCSSYWASISADGRYVAFNSDADSLVAGDTNGLPDVFVRDLQSGLTTRVSIRSNGDQGNGSSGPASFDPDKRSGPSISGDGRYVAFNSEASNLVDGDTNNMSDIFVHDRVTGTTVRVSVDSSGTEGNAHSYQPAISSNGRYVAFNSEASNLVAEDTNADDDVFVHDLQTGTTTRVSVRSDGGQASRGGNGWQPGISADGRYVVFESWAVNLVDSDTNVYGDIFLHDRQSGQTRLVSVSSNGTQSNSISYRPSISADGNYIAFASRASTLVPEQTYSNINTYWRNLQSGETRLVSVDAATGTTGTGPSIAYSISADGRYVAFDSFSDRVVNGDTNRHQDVFVRDMQMNVTRRISSAPGGGDANDQSYWIVLSADGKYAAFTSHASNLVPTDTNGNRDVYVVDHGALIDPPVMFSKTSPVNWADEYSTSPTLTWESSFGTDTYEYCYDTSNDGDCAPWVATGDSTSASLSNLTPGLTYYWHVRAVNLGGTTYSNIDETDFWRFTIPCYSLSLNVNPIWGGSISADPAPNCNNGTQYTHETVVTLTANANAGYGFSSWDGAVSGSNNPTQVTMTDLTFVTAVFDQTCFTLYSSVLPLDGGSIIADPAPNCPGDPTKYSAGTVVALTAAPNLGFAFSEWSGDATGALNPIEVTLSTDRNMVANFVEQCFSLSVASSPIAGGSVGVSPAPNCVGDPSKYLAGTIITLTASPNSSYVFSAWGGDAGGFDSPTDIMILADSSVVAYFTQGCYTLTTSANPVLGGSVEASPPPNCSGDPTRYATGTLVTLTASANTGYTFASWSGDAGGTVSPASVTMNADRSVTANFSELCYTLTTNASPAGGGSVDASPSPNCNGGTQYTHGTVVTITASASTGYGFTSWSGDASGSANPASLTMTADRSVTANFSELCYTLSTNASPAGGGSIDASPAPNCNGGAQYTHGTLVTLAASPNAGYQFASWSGDAGGSGNPTTVTMSANRSVTATFSQTCYTLALTANPSAGGAINANPAPNCNNGTQYTQGSLVTLTAVPNAGYNFASWSGDAGGSANPIQVSLTAHRSVTANFALNGSVAVLSIARLDENPTSQYKVEYLVTFSKSVRGVDLTDFQLTDYGLSQTRVTKIATEDQTQYTLTVITGHGNGALRLDVLDDDSIHDTSGVPLGGAGTGNGIFTAGEIYTVVNGPTFVDVPMEHWAWMHVESLFNAGVTSGCWTEPAYFCPNTSVSRDQMAVFLLRAMYGAKYTPPEATGAVFADVPADYWAADWIEQLAAEGISSGCGSGNYCPGTLVTRDQMAIFLLRAMYGAGYVPPPASGMFADVPSDYWAAAWIEQLAREGVTSGCGGGNYCPGDVVTRAQMSIFLAAAFDLPLIGELPVTPAGLPVTAQKAR